MHLSYQASEIRFASFVPSVRNSLCIFRTSCFLQRIIMHCKKTGSEIQSKQMTQTKIVAGVVHEVPADLQVVLQANEDLLDKWEKLTPLARNEWICWLTIVKKAETRAEHLVRLQEELLEGQRRPCCWPGCPHRRTSAKKWFK